jgi:3-hydroxyacyl-[acyl-carrier-protein] dehydratase
MKAETLDAAGIQQVLAALPHRYPFLMVDKVVQIRDSESIVGIKNVTFNEPHFLGHFPGNPVMPGVLMLEGMAQTAGVLCVLSTQAKAQTVYLLTIDKAKFRKPVVPGDTLHYHMTRMARRRNMWWFSGRAMVDDQLVAEAELGAMIIEP